VLPPTFAADLSSQVDQAFRNIDRALRAAGGRGLSQVYQIRSYHPKNCGEAMPVMKANLFKWFPDHKPIWTAVGVDGLGLPEMLVEIEAVAYDPQSVEGGKVEGS
jgi:enamine deaminase RidA (YjgF/YER057c/UK114 family)